MVMPVVHNETHRVHFPQGELSGGRLVRPFECPERVDRILAALEHEGFEAPIPPQPISVEELTKIHDSAYLKFLQSAWDEWAAGGNDGDMIPTFFPGRRMQQRIPSHIDGRLGYYASAADTAITAGTWAAARDAAAIAATAAQVVSDGAPAAFALCRPPGHHAARDYFGGYCFVNNAAVAAQRLRDQGADRVAILDVDFHHGNGTQDIFSARDDIYFASLHGDPQHEFPHFSGYADETGVGAGEGTTANYPLPPGTDGVTWRAALDDALSQMMAWGPDALVVSLGVDTFVGDPISSFMLEVDDFTTYGRTLGALALPTVYCMEGGYAVAEIGTNTVNVLVGHHEGG